MARVWCIYSAKTEPGPDNLAFGMRTSTWGLTRPPQGGTPALDDFVLFGMDVPGGPRQDSASWQGKSSRLILGQVTSGLYTGTAPHWPDEVDAAAVKYPYRFGFVPVGSAQRISLSAATGPLDAATSEALRMSGPGNAAYLSPTATVSSLFASLSVAVDPGTGKPNMILGSALTQVDPDVDESVGAFAGPGRSADPKLRTAVEQHAVAMATAHMHGLGWTDIEPLGKPYDLVCRNRGGEKHVEVKGTTGAGGSVEYTENEVAHFRSCAEGADLIVVREIEVDRTVDPYLARGGRLVHIPNYRAPETDLKAVRYHGRVQWR